MVHSSKMIFLYHINCQYCEIQEGGIYFHDGNCFGYEGTNTSYLQVVQFNGTTKVVPSDAATSPKVHKCAYVIVSYPLS